MCRRMICSLQLLAPTFAPACTSGYQRKRDQFDIWLALTLSRARRTSRKVKASAGDGQRWLSIVAPSRVHWTTGFAGQSILRVMGHNPKTDIVVEVVGHVPVAVSTARVPMIVVPRAAPHCAAARPPSNGQTRRSAPTPHLISASHPAGGLLPLTCARHVRTGPD